MLVPDELLDKYGLPKAEGGGCGFRMENNDCFIYDSRPSVCDVYRTFQDQDKIKTWDDYKKHTEEECKKLQEYLGL